MQLRVVKADGSSEVYLHTKVLGTISAALADSGSYQHGKAEQLAEAVTTFLRRRYGNTSVSSDEIYSMIEIVLGDTGHEAAALALHDHRLQRAIRRRRVEVVYLTEQQREQLRRDGEDIDDSLLPVQAWNKSMIIRDMETQWKVPRYLAQAVAGHVEDRILQLECRQITSDLLREFVINELLMVRKAEKALRPDTPSREPSVRTACGSTVADEPDDAELALAGAESGVL